MAYITLSKAARVPLNGPLRDKGYTADVDDDTYNFLKNHGVLVEAEPKKAEPAEPAEVKPEKAVEPVKEQPMAGPKRPSRTANVNAWRDYASQLGIKTSGMKKEEIIGAVTKFEK